MTQSPLPHQRDRVAALDGTPSMEPVFTSGRLDQHSTAAVADTLDSRGRTELGAYHGLQVLRLAEDTLGVPRLPDHGPKAVLGQHLLASLMTYQNSFAPNTHWTLTAIDIRQGALRWTCRSTEIPDVIDVFSRSHRSTAPVRVKVDSATFTRVHHNNDTNPRVTAFRQRWAPVLRHCDATDPRGSTLTFPGEATVAWCAADDPIISRELAWPNRDHATFPFPTIGQVTHPAAAPTGRHVRTLSAPSRHGTPVIDLTTRLARTRMGGPR